MWKMQLLDENHLLIKYAHEEVVTLRSHEPNSQLAFFVVYNFTTTEVKTRKLQGFLPKDQLLLASYCTHSTEADYETVYELE